MPAASDHGVRCDGLDSTPLDITQRGMTMHTLDRFDIAIRDAALEEIVSSYESHWTHVRTFRHEDGSVTVVELEEYVEPFMNPRDSDCNVAHLVNESRDYVDMDLADDDIAEARRRWEDGYAAPYSEWTHYRQTMVRRYIAMFRPDIAHYEDRWEVSGSSQSDWQYGWGYVTVADLESAGFTGLPPFMAGRRAFADELKVYSLYFSGEVYRATRLSPGEPFVEYGDHGAYVSGWSVNEDSMGGFLGYAQLEDIVAEVTDSPIVD